jgi:phage terminase large subunit-like protein
MFVEAATRRDASGVIACRGGNRSGKTDSGAYITAYWSRVVLDKIARERSAKGLETKVWAVGTGYEHCGETLWKEKLRGLLPPAIIEEDGIDWLKRSAEWPKAVRLRNGVEIVFKSADQGRKSMQAAGLQFAWIDEQIDPALFSEIRTRLVDSGGPIVWTFTPLEPDPNLEQALTDPPKGYQFFQMDIEDNRRSRGGHLPDSEVDLWLAQMQAQFPDEFETRKRGELTATQGLIYKNFRRATHVVSGGEMRSMVANRKAELSIRCGVDFGRSAPMAVVWGARDGDGRWYIFAEHHRAEWSIDRHEGVIRATNDEWGVSPQWYACDPGDGSTSTMGQDVVVSGRKHLRDAGHEVVNAVKKWSDGVRTVQRLLAPEIAQRADGSIEYGEPMLYISDECPNLIREMGLYQRAPDGPRTDGEGPLKKNDHAVDALRYLLHTSAMRYDGEDVGTGAAGGERFARRFQMPDRMQMGTR